MTHKKSYIKIISIVFLIFSCGREYQVQLNIEAKNPVTDEPIENVSFFIQKISGSKNIKTDLLISGVTNANGNATAIWDANSRFAYELNWDLNTSNIPAGDYEVLRNDGGLLYFDKQPHEIKLWIVPKLKVVRHIYNINCQSPNDSMRYRYRLPNTYPVNWSNWLPQTSLYHFGCENTIINLGEIGQDSVYLEIEVTRNGNSSIIRDSMLLDPTKVQDTIKIYY